jgi:cytochrome c
MRLVSRTVGLALAAALCAAVGTGATLRAQEKDDEEDEENAAALAERKRVADEALAKAVARGKEIWLDAGKEKRFKKACTSCHDNPDKPTMNLATRPFAYPAYSRRRRGVVTMHQKLQEMIAHNSKGAPFDDKGPDIAALEAYVMSLRKR